MRKHVQYRVFFASLLLSAIFSQVVQGTGESLPTVSVIVTGQIFVLEVAATVDARTRGLMHRSEIPADQGMLFVFPEAAPRRFWMAYTLVDLDAIFLDHEGRIVGMHRMRAEAPRGAGESEAAYFQRIPSYSSTGPAQFVIEFAAGTLELLELKNGERIPGIVSAARPFLRRDR